jgi:long-chain acyl-CoA synthetase
MINLSDLAASSLPQRFREAASRFAERPAIRFHGRTTPYRLLDRASDLCAAGLAAKGIGKGDRVGLYCPNSDAFAVAYFGILKAGATAVPINLLLNPKEIAYILNDSGARALLYHEAFGEQTAALAALTDTLAWRACIGSRKAAEGDLLWSDLLALSAALPTVSWNAREDVAVLLYTSGTTGFPKGAMLTHFNLLANVASVWEAMTFKEAHEVFVVVLPMFHAFAATACLLTPLFHGCTIVPLPRFEPAQVAEAIETEQATIFMGVPSMYAVLMRLPPEATARFRSLRFCISGGAALPVELMKQFETRFGLPIYEGDGPTECSPVTCVNPIGGRRKPGTVGLPVPGVDMSIRDDQGRDLPQGEVGEICVRGPNVMKGYWNRPQDTAESFFGDWFRTGDLGSVDEDGYFSIVDRKKDLIIVNGMNVYPRMVEEVLYRNPAVREAAVVAEPHELHGEIPVAYVALRDGASATAHDLRAFCQDNLGRHEIPRKFFFMNELPKNAAGKILKRALRRQGEIERGVKAGPDTPGA